MHIIPRSKWFRDFVIFVEVVLGVFVAGSLYLTGNSQPLMLGFMAWMLIMNLQLQLCEKYRFAAFSAGVVLIGVLIVTILRPFMGSDLMSVFFGFEAPTAFLLLCYPLMRSV